MGIKQKLENWIEEGLEIESPVLVHSKEIKNGDYTLILNEGNVEELANELNKNLIPSVSKVEFVAPRFINIFLSSKFFEEEILGIGEGYGKTDLLNGQKIIIEYTNTNVLKPLHIGHLMGNVLGQSVSNILEASRAEVKRNTYQGDVGLHIAKALWGIKKSGGIIEGELSEKVNYVGQAYSIGANAYEDNPEAQEEIKEINKKVFERSDSELINIYKWAREVSLSHFEELYKKLSTKFDYYFFESEVSEDALKIVQEFLKKGIFEESDGAVVFKGEKYDPKLHTRVFVSSQGIPMYEAKDIAHALRKEGKYKSDQSIIITANEQDSYFKVVLKALEQINPEIAKKTKHLSHGILKLSDGKMSSRKGNIITGESLIEDVEALVQEKIKDRDFSDEEKREVTEIVAIGAIKYSILRQAIGGDIIFDFDKSLSFEGDSGPYLQYAYIRAKSVLEKAKGLPLPSPLLAKERGEDFPITEVEKIIYRFPEVVERAGKEYAPHYLVTYLTELAGAFNSFYAQNKIIDEGDPTSPYKVALTEAVSHILKNGLHLLGIKVPEKM